MGFEVWDLGKETLHTQTELIRLKCVAQFSVYQQSISVFKNEDFIYLFFPHRLTVLPGFRVVF